MKRWIAFFIITSLTTVLVGCGEKQQRPWDTLAECEQENTELSLQAQQLQDENTELTRQIETLKGLDSDVRFETIDTLDKIRIGKRTGFYDKDDNGSKETLVVYLEPLDTAQDYIKAIGQATIELWDLDAAADETKPVRWTVEPTELHTLWGGTIFGSYYRIKLPLEKGTPRQKDYTLKVTFTDYLSGKKLTDQKVIQP